MAQAAGRLAAFHPIVTTLPSLRGWQPGGSPSAAVPRWRQPALLSNNSAAAAGAAFSTLSDSVRITPAIEAQLDRIHQRHDDLVQQLSGNAMSL